MALDKSVDRKDQKSSVRTIRYHLTTLFLFTKSDIKTVLIPQSAFALVLAFSKARAVLAPSVGNLDIVSRVPCMLVWMWLHLLVTTISNQRRAEDVIEDKENKPWRPLPAARLSLSEARSLLRIVAWVSLTASLLFGGFVPGVTLMTLLWMYNDLGGSSASVLERNLITTGGLTCYGWGATEILLAGNMTPEGGRLLKNWVMLMGAMMATTVQAQDFPDTIGDAARGRRTVPVVYGSRIARVSLAVPTAVWSLACPAFWKVGILAWSAPIAVGGMMAGLTLAQWNQRANEWVWRLWCLWQTTIYLMPLFSRISE
ncbi:hypothetical protein F4861DRAFT_100997 [Xylaria intraflava]|nr:hypothetical protein F4861DRAFT_100997 [Xylaria intraflava]